MTASAEPTDAVSELAQRGSAEIAAGRLFEAAAVFQAALRLEPEQVPILLQLGSLWHRLGHRESALPCYRLAAKLAPNRPEALYLLATLLCELRELDEAVDLQRRALALAPDQPEVLSELGNALMLRGGEGEIAEGMSYLRRAVSLAPGWAMGHVHLGVGYVRLKDAARALDCFRAAEELDPSCDYARFCESNVHLMLGDYKRGYAMYDAHRAVYPHRYRQRRWKGDELDGRTLLLYAQHGLGDTLQFVRYVPRVAKYGGRVVLQVQSQLLPLLGEQPGAAEVLVMNDGPVSFDVQATLLELPAVLGHELHTLPAEVPYLRADPGLCEVWAARLDREDGFKIGLAWHGNPKQKDGLIRSCNVLDMAPLWSVPGVITYSLQVGAGEEQLRSQEVEPFVRDLGAIDRVAGPFMDTAAIMQSLDLIVTIDTAVAHLAGGLGRPVWLVLPYWSDWRWGLLGNKSPWYPTMRIFRQSEPGAWGPVFDEVTRALQQIEVRGPVAHQEKEPF